MAGDGVLTSTEAARLLGVSATCLRDLIAAGELGRVETTLTATGQPSRHRAYVVTRAEVFAYVERARVQRGDLRHLWPHHRCAQ